MKNFFPFWHPAHYCSACGARMVAARVQGLCPRCEGLMERIPADPRIGLGDTDDLMDVAPMTGLNLGRRMKGRTG